MDAGGRATQDAKAEDFAVTDLKRYAGPALPARPGCITPHIRFLFIAPQFWIGLPSDPISR